MRRILVHLLFPIAVFLCGAAAQADDRGEEIISLMDKSMTTATDQEFVFDIITEKPGEEPRTMTIHVWVKGKKYRRVEFLAPGDVKGTRVLVRSVTQSYVYLPSYKRVRRIASHTREQGFMGTAMSQDDMSIVTYGELFAGKLIEETDTHWKVEAVLRPGEEYSYGRIEFDVLKEVRQPSELRYYSKKGVHIKTETRKNYTCQGGTCNAKSMIMVDHSRNGLKTELVRKEWKVDPGIPDSFFTIRSLQRRR